MTWSNRLRLTFGLLVVVAVTLLLTYQLNEREGRAGSSSAQIAALTYHVGSPYAGLVVDQLVEPGDAVEEGDALFVIDSAALRHDREIGFAPVETAASAVDAEGRLVVKATGPGTIVSLKAERGTFVEAVGDLAVVEKADSLYVQAEYTLSAKDYARVEDAAAVTIVLPNQQRIAGHVDEVSVQTVASQAQAVVKVRSDGLVKGDANGLVAAGTPVSAELALRNDGVVTRAVDAVKGYLREAGL